MALAGAKNPGSRAVSVIIPTLARGERAEQTRAALRSVWEQTRCQPIPLVVVNGPDPDPEFVQTLEADPRIQWVRTPRASLSGALYHGRLATSTPWVSALDDDDLLLPGSLAARIDRLESDPTIDVVVGNGLRREGGVDTGHWLDPEVIRRDPLGSMARSNWMLPGAWLARTDRVGADPFSGAPYGAECTYLGLYFALHHRVSFLDEPVVVWQKDSPNSMSKNRRYVVGEGAAIERILQFDLPPTVRDSYVRKRTDAFHSLSDLCRREGDLRAAWRWHIRTLTRPGGWRHLLFSRRLIQTFFGRLTG